jgi:2-polyprenyl-3-methyl-5-hydroxy-6-metoxy-1,4-benzoquinol methylase
MDVRNCPACGSYRYISYPHPVYRRCHDCNSLYQFTGIEEIIDYYDGKTPDFSNQTGSYRNYLRIMQEFIKFETYKLIDIGAGDGTFLDIAKPLFQQVMGLDTSPTAKSYLEEKGFLLDQHLADLSPKIITAWQVIEHVQDPRQFINRFAYQRV